MVSTGMEPDDCRPTSAVAQPEIAVGNNDLCRLCLKALTINDQAAGGVARENGPDGKTTLDLAGLMHDSSKESSYSGFRQKRYFYNHYSTRGAESHRLCAGDQHQRLVTLPRMLEISASAPCRLCARLRALFIEQYAGSSWWNEHGSTLRFTIQYEWTEYRRFFESEFAVGFPRPSQSLDGMAVFVDRPGQGPYERDVYQFDVVAWPGPCQQWLKIKQAPLDPDGPTSDRNVGFMKQRIAKCIRDHPKCEKKTFNLTFVPRRLLDLGDDKSKSARLIESGKTLSLPYPKTQLQYATLSYCWGKSLTMTTTTANKLRHETTGIDVHSMPATFQDAIHVAKKLGIRYLWIDALCIVQDDMKDWEAEAVTMCDIFAHAHVTISAAKSSSAVEHFLQRPVDEMVTLQFQSILDPDILGQYSIRLEPRHAKPAEHDLERSQWVSRTWVLQEEIMSTRQVVFGNRCLQFRCSTGTFFEDGRFEFNTRMVQDASTPFWIPSIPIYSSRKLTYASDKLKAIAGVAKYMENSNHAKGQPTQYLVGLWQNHRFEEQLRWVCQKPSLSYKEMMGLFRDEKQYIAPSWTWASRNTGVECLLGGTETAFEVIKSDLRPSHTSAMVSVAFGSSITISGKFRQTPVEPSSGRLVTDPGRWSYRWEASSAYGRTDFWLDWVPKEDDVEEQEHQSCLCLLLSTVFEISGLTAAGLIIAPSLDPGTGDTLYYRVGAFIHMGDRQMLTSEREQVLTIL